MKFAKQLIALAVVGAAFSAQAESNINSVNAVGQNTSARLNFSVVVPRVIFLKVGTGTNFAVNGAIDTNTFTVAAANVGSGSAVAGSLGAVGVQVLGNGGAVSLTANGTAGGLTGAGLQSIPWSQFALTQSNASLPNPAIGNGVAGAISAMAATNNVVNQSGTWTFNYSNGAVMGAGTYTGQVSYTAALP